MTVESSDLVKVFNGFTAVNGVTFEIKKGELFGLLGPNGAGKTTTIRMLCTLLEPTSGTARVAGFDVVEEPKKVRSKIGVVSEGVMLYRDLNAYENLELLGRLYRMPLNDLKQRINKLLDFLDLKNRAHELIGNFSTGMMKRVHVAAALIHEPEILFLDEVTTGLDPQSATKLREFTRELCHQGITTIWTTHYMFEPERLCDRVAIVNRGKISMIDTPDGIRNSVKNFDILDLLIEKYNKNVVPKLRHINGVLGLFFSENRLRLMVRNHEIVFPEIMAIIKESRAIVRSVNVTIPTLEEAFVILTGESSYAANTE